VSERCHVGIPCALSYGKMAARVAVVKDRTLGASFGPYIPPSTPRPRIQYMFMTFISTRALQYEEHC